MSYAVSTIRRGDGPRGKPDTVIIYDIGRGSRTEMVGAQAERLASDVFVSANIASEVHPATDVRFSIRLKPNGYRAMARHLLNAAAECVPLVPGRA